MRASAMALLCLGLAGCRQLFGFDNAVAPIGDDAPPIDQAEVADTTPEAPPIDGCTTWSAVVDTCVASPEADIVIEGSVQYDTDTFLLTGVATTTPQHVVFATSTGDLVAIYAATFRIKPGSTLRVIGARPFAVVANAIQIDGTLDLARGGAGSRGTSCGASTGGVGQNDVGGAAGGGGGGFQGLGGVGGNGDSDGGQSNGGSAGQSIALPVAPLGGCSGGKGGNAINNGGPGGVGGGALLLTASNAMSITGVVNAVGGGGQGGLADDGGGGGGGSGGMIMLEAPNLSVAGNVVAQGGGGGEGANGVSNGEPGDDGTLTGQRANGGAAVTTGADGGRGSGDATLFGLPGGPVQTGGGGGGGGGAGFITIRGAVVSTGVISPTAQQL